MVEERPNGLWDLNTPPDPSLPCATLFPEPIVHMDVCIHIGPPSGFKCIVRSPPFRQMRDI